MYSRAIDPSQELRSKQNKTGFLKRTHWSVSLRHVPHDPIFHEEFRFDVCHPGVLPHRLVEFISRTAAVGRRGEQGDGPGRLLTGGGDIQGALLKKKRRRSPRCKRWTRTDYKSTCRGHCRDLTHTRRKKIIASTRQVRVKKEHLKQSQTSRNKKGVELKKNWVSFSLVG